MDKEMDGLGIRPVEGKQIRWGGEGCVILDESADRLGGGWDEGKEGEGDERKDKREEREEAEEAKEFSGATQKHPISMTVYTRNQPLG